MKKIKKVIVEGNLNLIWEPKEVNILIGERGCGKTRLLNIIAYMITGGLEGNIEMVEGNRATIELEDGDLITLDWNIDGSPKLERKENGISLSFYDPDEMMFQSIGEEIFQHSIRLAELYMLDSRERFKEVVDYFIPEFRIIGGGKVEKEGKVFDASELSTGEKTILILLTKAWKYDICLLDLPEFGIDIFKQKMILPKLKYMTPETQFLVATHSPFVFENEYDEMAMGFQELLQAEDH